MWKNLYYMQLIEDNGFNIFKNRKRNFKVVTPISRNNSTVPYKKARLNGSVNGYMNKMKPAKKEKKRNTNNNRGSYSKQSLYSIDSSQSVVKRLHYRPYKKTPMRLVTKSNGRKKKIIYKKPSKMKKQKSIEFYVPLPPPFSECSIVDHIDRTSNIKIFDNKPYTHFPRPPTIRYPQVLQDLNQESIIYNDFINHFSDSESESLQKIILKKSFSCSDFSKNDIWEEDSRSQESLFDKQSTINKRIQTSTLEPDSLEASRSDGELETSEAESTESNSYCPFTDENFRKFQSLMATWLSVNVNDPELKKALEAPLNSKKETSSNKNSDETSDKTSDGTKTSSHSSSVSDSKEAKTTTLDTKTTSRPSRSTTRENEEELNTLEKIKKLFAEHNFKNCDQVYAENLCNPFCNCYTCIDNCDCQFPPDRFPRCQLSGKKNRAMPPPCPTNFDMMQNRNCFNNKSMSQSMSQIMMEQMQQHQMEQLQLEQQIEQQKLDQQQQLEQQTQIEGQQFMEQQLQLQQRLSQPSNVNFPSSFYPPPSSFPEEQDTTQQQNFKSPVFFTLPYIFPKKPYYPEILKNKKKQSRTSIASKRSRKSRRSRRSVRSATSAGSSHKKNKTSKTKSKNPSIIVKPLSQHKINTKSTLNPSNIKSVGGVSVKPSKKVHATSHESSPYLKPASSDYLKKTQSSKAPHVAINDKTPEKVKSNINKANKKNYVLYTDINSTIPFSQMPSMVGCDKEKLMRKSFLSFGETLQLVRLDTKSLLRAILNKMKDFMSENIGGNAEDFGSKMGLENGLIDKNYFFEKSYPSLHTSSDFKTKKRKRKKSKKNKYYNLRRELEASDSSSDSSDTGDSDSSSDSDESVLKYLKKEIKKMAKNKKSKKYQKFLKPGYLLSDRSSSDSLYQSMKKRRGYKKWGCSSSSLSLYNRWGLGRQSRYKRDSPSDILLKHDSFYRRNLSRNYINPNNDLSKISLDHNAIGGSKNSLNYSPIIQPSALKLEHSRSSFKDKLCPRISQSTRKNQNSKILLNRGSKDDLETKDDNKKNTKIHYVIVKDERDAKKTKKFCSLPELESLVNAIDLGESGSTVHVKKDLEASSHNITTLLQAVKTFLNYEKLFKLKNSMEQLPSLAANNKPSSIKVESDSLEKFSETSTLKGSDSYKSKASFKVFPKTKLLSSRSSFVKRSNKQDRLKSSSDFSKSEEIEKKKKILNDKKKVLESLKSQMLNKIKLIMKNLPKDEDIDSPSSQKSKLSLASVSGDSIVHKPSREKKKKLLTKTFMKPHSTKKNEEKVEEKQGKNKQNQKSKTPKKNIEKTNRKRKSSSSSTRSDSTDKEKNINENENIRKQLKKIIKQMLKKEKKKSKNDSEDEETPNEKPKKIRQVTIKKHGNQKISIDKKRKNSQQKNKLQIHKPPSHKRFSGVSLVARLSPAVRARSRMRNDASTEESSSESSGSSTSSLEICVSGSSEEEDDDVVDLWEGGSEKDKFIKNFAHLY